MLGYSSVMHMGYAFLGLACLSVAGAGGALLMMVAHGLSVALLFMLSTSIFHRSRTFDMSKMGGLAQHAPVLSAFFVAGTMASIGLPGFGNFWGEFTIFVALAESDLTRWIVRLPQSELSSLRSMDFVRQLRSFLALRLIRPLNYQGVRSSIKGYEKLPACILLDGLLIIGIFPRVISDNTDLELAHSYPFVESSLPSHSMTVIPDALLEKEDTH